MSNMFCFQCEQRAGLNGCSAYGVCGKDPEVAALQDLVLYAASGIGTCVNQLKLEDEQVNGLMLEALFATVTNVNFDPQSLAALLQRLSDQLEVLNRSLDITGQQSNSTPGACQWRKHGGVNDLVREGEKIRIDQRMELLGHDVAGLQELLTYGLKGLAAYAWHARVLGQEDPAVYAFTAEALAALARSESDVDTLIGLSLKAGEINLRVMELLDTAHNQTFGSPEPSPVRIDPVAGKCILVSGHDLADLKVLLEQTENTGINIYTHGEMLPAHGYPELKKYKHLVGNYGGAWQDQQQEFDAFPGAILMTTNCIQKPKASYIDRIFTCGPVAWPEVKHLEERNFAPLIEAAKQAPGFTEDGAGKTILTGFGHNAVLGLADTVVGAVKSGAVKHFFLVGGCDGARPGRNYFTEFAESVPQDSVVMTLGCGKFRFNKLEFGDIGGIPRLLDVGQCNDAFSAIKIALALAEAFECGVNDLPLSLIISWYEQKAVAVLLTLLHLGVRGIRLGPSLPSFVSPNVLRVLSEKYNLMPTGEAKEDLAACLAS